MSRGGAFDSLFCPEGWVYVHNDCPGGGGFLLPSSRVPGRGWFWMKLIRALLEHESDFSHLDSVLNFLTE